MIKKPVKIGIPKALLYYKYGDLWENFFNELKCEVIWSEDTNKKILEQGKNLSIDESCLSLKIFLGHVDNLLDKADYIIVPRIRCLKKKEKMCTNFTALYDIVKSVFNTNIIDYNIDVEKGKTEKKAFKKMGKFLSKGKQETYKAYCKAKRIAKRNNEHRIIKQEILLEKSEKTKILLVSHPYNTYDNLIGKVIFNQLKDLDVDVIYANVFDSEKIKEKYKKISEKVYWTYSKELLGSIVYYYEKVDGIILLSVFPCGPDSLTNEMCIRKLRKPITNIIIDELTAEAGLQTRIESFVDIINEQKKRGVNKK